MKTRAALRILRLASILALFGLGLMVWSLFEPTPMPVLVAMSAGQLCGTLSLVAFLVVVIADLRGHHLERPAAPSEPPDAGMR